MTTCYKCGKEVPGPNPECEDGCGLPPFASELPQSFREFDWSKVTTPEEVRLVFSLLNFHMAIPESHPHFEQLKRFLK